MKPSHTSKTILVAISSLFIAEKIMAQQTTDMPSKDIKTLFQTNGITLPEDHTVQLSYDDVNGNKKLDTNESFTISIRTGESTFVEGGCNTKDGGFTITTTNYAGGNANMDVGVYVTSKEFWQNLKPKIK